MIHWTDPLRGVTGSMTFADWWNSCFRGDYMVQMLRCVGYPDDRKLRLLACRLVRETRIDSHRTRTVWDLTTSKESRRRVRKTVTVAERYAIGAATDAELDAEWSAESATTTAVRASAWVIGWATAMKSALAQQADIVRSVIPAEEVEPLFERYALRLLLTKNDCKLLNEQCKIDR